MYFGPTYPDERNKMIRQILGKADEDTFINQPFHCDFGKHIRVGKRFFANFNFTVLDEAKVTIGDNCRKSSLCRRGRELRVDGYVRRLCQDC